MALTQVGICRPRGLVRDTGDRVDQRLVDADHFTAARAQQIGVYPGLLPCVLRDPATMPDAAVFVVEI